jgi:putative Mg2+ transporter-C (MgtC) family protein
VLVAVGAAIFVDMANRLGGAEGAVRVVAYVVSGIGFRRGRDHARGRQRPWPQHRRDLVDFRRRRRLRRADLLAEAVLGTLFILAANTLLRPIVNNINRQPLDVVSAEVTNIVYVIARRSQQKAVFALLEAELERSNYWPATSMYTPSVPTKSRSKPRWRPPRSTVMNSMRWRGSRRRRWWCRRFWSPSTTE